MDVVGCPIRFRLRAQDLEDAGGLASPASHSFAVYSFLSHITTEFRTAANMQGTHAGGCWYVLTRGSTLDPQVKRQLDAGAIPLHVFPRGTSAANTKAKGSWSTGNIDNM